MKNANESSVVRLPVSLRDQLDRFRAWIRHTKRRETAVIGVACVALGFLVIFASERWFNTPVFLRLASLILVATIVGWLLLRLIVWFRASRTFSQLASLIRRRAPLLGDELLGAIELAGNAEEQKRSPQLCHAAVDQVAERAARRNLEEFAPRSINLAWVRLMQVAGGLAILCSIMTPFATWNSIVRWVAPWANTPRYTFARVDKLPSELVVPIGEKIDWDLSLASSTRWSPATATARISGQERVYAPLVAGRYSFEIDSVAKPTSLSLRAGDFTHRLWLRPSERPSPVAIRAKIELPKYLQRREVEDRDLRGGALSVVSGATVGIEVTADRELQIADLRDITSQAKQTSLGDGRDNAELKMNSANTLIATRIEANVVKAESLRINDGIIKLQMEWTDFEGLDLKRPLAFQIQGFPDAAPLVSMEGLPRDTIILNTEQLNFQIVSNDDFGVQEVGVEWWDSESLQIADDDLSGPATAPSSIDSRILAKGDPSRTNLVSLGSFRPIDWGIESQVVELKAWAIDFLPDRPRNYSAPQRLIIVRPDEHAIWIAQQFTQWQSQAIEVRDRELQLHAINRELRSLSPEQLSEAATQRRIEEQASAETSNERRLRSLTNAGQKLLQQAARNPELGVGHLERWAEMLNILDSISSQRMPKVTDLLRKASKEVASGGKPSNASPSAGIVRSQVEGGASETSDSNPQSTENKLPSLSDVESSMEKLTAQKEAAKSDGAKSAGSGFKLPTTTLIGPPQEPSDSNPKPEEPAMEQAVQEQAALLAEFDRVADELSDVLGNLEGSTLVKRLKAASREQWEVAQGISKRLQKLIANNLSRPNIEAELKELTDAESEGSSNVSNIMDDMQAYQARNRLVKFDSVLKEMKDTQVVAALRQLGDEMPKEIGLSIAQAEYWADTLDRWAEDLVDPANQGSCPGGKTSDSLPPSVVLEVLQILEGQVGLREETRVAEQIRATDDEPAYQSETTRLGKRQRELDDRVVDVTTKIQQLPDGSKRFADELSRLQQVDTWMEESCHLFDVPNTGDDSLAIQTSIIELLLESKRINPKSGGGGGATPGGGGQGSTGDAAIALVGVAMDNQAKSESRETGQTVGVTGSVFPEEFRDGLTEYFQSLERNRQ